jgi:hypothetical protein
MGEVAKWEQFLNRVGREELRKEQALLRAEQEHAQQEGGEQQLASGHVASAAPPEVVETSDGTASETPSVKHRPRPPPGPPPPPVTTAAPLASPVQSPTRNAMTPRSAMSQGGWLWRWWSDAADFEREEDTASRSIPHLPPPEQAAWFRVVYDAQSIPVLTWASGPEEVALQGCALRFTVVQKIAAFDRVPSEQDPSARAAPGSYLRVSLWHLGASFILRAPSPSLRDRWVKALSSFVSEHGAAPPPPPSRPPVALKAAVTRLPGPSTPREVRLLQDRGATALHLTARSTVAMNHPEKLAQMLAAGSDACAVDSLGRTPLHYALLPDSLLTQAPPPRTLGFAAYDYVSALAGLPAVPDAEDAVFEKYVLLLCDALGGTDALDAQDAYGATAVHVASGRSMLRSLRVLLQTAADPSLPDRKGRTPLDIASARVASQPTDTPSARAATACITVLHEYGAKSGLPVDNRAASSEDRQGAILEAFMAGALKRGLERAAAGVPSPGRSPRASKASSAASVGSPSSSSRNSPNETLESPDQRVKNGNSSSFQQETPRRSPSSSQSPPNRSAHNIEHTRRNSSRALPQLSPAARSAIQENTITDVLASPIMAPPPPMIFGSVGENEPAIHFLQDDDFLDPGRPLIRHSVTSPTGIAAAYGDTSPGSELPGEPIFLPPRVDRVASTEGGVPPFSESLEADGHDAPSVAPFFAQLCDAAALADAAQKDDSAIAEENAGEFEEYDEAVDALQSSMADLTTAGHDENEEFPWTEYWENGYVSGFFAHTHAHTRDQDFVFLVNLFDARRGSCSIFRYAYVYNYWTEESRWGTLAEHFSCNFSDTYAGGNGDNGGYNHVETHHHYKLQAPDPWDALSVSSTGESEVAAPTTNSTPVRALREATEEGLSQYLASPTPPAEYNSNAEEEAREVDENRRYALFLLFFYV